MAANTVIITNLTFDHLTLQLVKQNGEVIRIDVRPRARVSIDRGLMQQTLGSLIQYRNRGSISFFEDTSGNEGGGNEGGGNNPPQQPPTQVIVGPPGPAGAQGVTGPQGVEGRGAILRYVADPALKNSDIGKLLMENDGLAKVYKESIANPESIPFYLYHSNGPIRYTITSQMDQAPNLGAHIGWYSDGHLAPGTIRVYANMDSRPYNNPTVYPPYTTNGFIMAFGPGVTFRQMHAEMADKLARLGAFLTILMNDTEIDMEVYGRLNGNASYTEQLVSSVPEAVAAASAASALGILKGFDDGHALIENSNIIKVMARESIPAQRPVTGAEGGKVRLAREGDLAIGLSLTDAEDGEMVLVARGANGGHYSPENPEVWGDDKPKTYAEAIDRIALALYNNDIEF